MLDMLSRLKWLELPWDTRLKISQVFEIPKRGGTIVEGHRVVTDGFRDDDLALLTIERLQAYLHCDSTDFYALFDELAYKLNANYVEPIEAEASTSEQDAGSVDIGVEAKRRGRPKKVTSAEGVDPVPAI